MVLLAIIRNKIVLFAIPTVKWTNEIIGSQSILVNLEELCANYTISIAIEYPSMIFL